MSLTRDAIQGFVDGYLKAGGDPTKIADNITDWVDKHPLYPLSNQAKEIILSDLESYRGVPKVVVVPKVAPVEELIP